MKKTKTGGQKSRLRVDPFTLTQLLCEQNTTLSAVQQAAGIDPAELEPLRTARKIHLDTLNRLAAGLKVSVYQLMITAQSPWTVHHGGSGSRRAGAQIGAGARSGEPPGHPRNISAFQRRLLPR